MKRTSLILPALALVMLALGGGGCLSRLFARSAGGELVWWDDKRQERIGSPETYVPGMTQYNPETGKDELRPGVSQEEYQAALEARRAERERMEVPPEDLQLVRKKSWWQRFGDGEDAEEAKAPDEANPPSRSIWSKMKFWDR
jgi:hypothetical protein